MGMNEGAERELRTSLAPSAMPRVSFEINSGSLECLAEVLVGQLASAAILRGAERCGGADGLALGHATVRIAGGHVSTVVRGDHHPGTQQVLNPGHPQRAIGNAVGAAVLYLDHLVDPW